MLMQAEAEAVVTVLESVKSFSLRRISTVSLKTSFFLVFPYVFQSIKPHPPSHSPARPTLNDERRIGGNFHRAWLLGIWLMGGGVGTVRGWVGWGGGGGVVVCWAGVFCGVGGAHV